MKTAQQILDHQLSKHNTPGLQYYFFDKDSIIYSYEGGLADIINQQKVTENTTFNAYSVTKTFTALSILQLTEKGMFGLDDPVSDYLPDFPYPRTITIRQLLTHSSGIPNPLPLKWIHSANEHDTFDSKSFFKEIFQRHQKTKFRQNEQFSYSNLGYVLLGMLIEQVSGLTYEEYVVNHIIKKLGIPPDQLGFNIPDVNLHAKGYQKRWSILNFILGFMIDKSTIVDRVEGRWTSYINHCVNGTSYGGLIGSGGGFVSYLQELLKSDCRLISEEFKQQLFTENRLANGKGSKMCLSWFKGELNGDTYYTHAGGGFYYCEIRLYPDLGKGSVIMFNRTGMTDARFLDKVDSVFLDK